MVLEIFARAARANEILREQTHEHAYEPTTKKSQIFCFASTNATTPWPPPPAW